jgi:hypothetical protein
VSQRKKWPWVLLGLLILAVGISGGWLLKSCNTAYTSPASFAMTAVPSAAETVTVTIPNRAEQLGPAAADHPEQIGYKDSIAIPDALFEKLALMLRPPAPSWFSTWGPLASGLLVSLVALGGVLWSSHTNRASDASSEWFRRFEAAQELALSTDGDHIQLGIKLLLLHMGSTLAGVEEKNLARAVLAQVMESALLRAGVKDPAAPAEPGQSDVHFVVTEPAKDP